MSDAFASAPPTAAMATVGLSFVDVQEVAQHVVNLLQSEGERALSVVKNTLLLMKAVTARDMLGVFAALNAVVTDLNALIAAIKAEFALE